MGVSPDRGARRISRIWRCFGRGNTPLYGNRIAEQISKERGLSFTENAHLFPLLNVSMADAAIACRDGKYRYVFWRPITAIREGTIPADSDPTWIPWLDFFPVALQRIPSIGRDILTVSGSPALIPAAAFGENTAFSIDSETLPGKIRSFASFTDATTEIANACFF